MPVKWKDKVRHCLACVPCLFAVLMLMVSQPSAPAEEISWHASGKNGAVAAGHADSVAAGLRILDGGGRAADAAAATILALAVTDYGSFAIGGTEFIVIEGRVTCSALNEYHPAQCLPRLRVRNFCSAHRCRPAGRGPKQNSAYGAPNY